MAQHVPIQQFTQKSFQKIHKSIEKDFARSMPTGSLKYEWLRRVLRDSDYKDYQINENDEIFTTDRHIGKGFIYGSDRGCFEVHYDKKLKKILEIYLVA